MQPSLDPTTLGAILDPLRATNNAIAACYPGESAERQPVHTVYGGAHLFRANTAAKLRELALRSLDTYAPDAGAFANAIGLTGDETEQVLIYERVRNKLEREPVEDFRIDFEDGYGNRPDDEEDASAVAAAQALAEGLAAGTLPFFSGIRIKPFSGELQRRSIRTLDLFVTTLFETTGGQLPENFVITFPKVMDVAQIKAFIEILRRLEAALGLATPLRVELMIETTQSILDANGVCPMSAFVEACEGRCLAAHFGVYDYTAGCSITAQHQTLDHPACDFARHAMQVALGGTGVWLSDGATNVLPVAPHRASEGPPLTAPQEEKTPASCTTPGAFTSSTSVAPYSSATTRVGTSTRRSYRRATRQCSPSSARAWGRPRSVSTTSSRSRRRQRSLATSSTTPPPDRGCSTSSCAA